MKMEGGRGIFMSALRDGDRVKDEVLSGSRSAE